MTAPRSRRRSRLCAFSCGAAAGIPVDCRRSRSARGGRLWLGCFRSLPRGFGRLDSWLFRPTTGARATGMGSLAVAACCRRAHMGRESSAIHIRGTDGNRGYGGPEQGWKHGVAFSKLPEPQKWFFRAGWLIQNGRALKVSKRGQFRLTRLANARTLLEGTTWYQHGLWPAEYWRWWADAIVLVRDRASHPLADSESCPDAGVARK